MTVSILTLFPEMFACLNYSIIKRALEKKKLTIEIINIRSFATDAYKSVDDHTYGGGVGMVMRVDIIGRALQKLKGRKILLDPQGKTYTQEKARELAKHKHLILICGHYEGVDERVRSLVDEEISIGDYVLTGGEIPAMVLIDSIARLLPGVLPKGATESESFSQNSLEYPQYTRPVEYKNMKVPAVLLSGHHAEIEKWRREQARSRTKTRRPELLTARRGRG